MNHIEMEIAHELQDMEMEIADETTNAEMEIDFKGELVSGGGMAFETDETLTFKDGVLSVNTADVVEKDNTLPVTSAAVASQVGNIEILLKTI